MKLFEFAEKNLLGKRKDIVGVRIENKVYGLQENVPVTENMQFVTLREKEGERIYEHSLVFLLCMASKILFPEGRLVVEHSISEALFLTFRFDRPLNKKDVRRIEEKMRELVEKDLPIRKKLVNKKEAIKICRKNGNLSKIKLIETLKKEKFTIFICGDFEDWIPGPLVPSTSYLEKFSLRHYSPGFILRYPVARSYPDYPPFVELPKLFLVFHEHEKWGEILGFHNLGSLNELIKQGNAEDIINVSEALHEKKIAMIADEITHRILPPKIVLIAGPSASGKTTFAKRLSIHLRVNGWKPHSISIDDYFVERDKTPKDEEGNYDFECIEAVDIEFFNSQLLALLDGKEVELPKFNFKEGKRVLSGKKIRLGKRGILIIEGIHGLNERLTPHVPKHLKFKIYVSALTQLNIHDHYRISTSDTRLIRRIIRDNAYRGHLPEDTISMWAKVRKGEEKNIFPFQEEADVMFNSALTYEQAVLKKFAMPLLKSIPPTHPSHAKAYELLEFLSYFHEIPAELVPKNSIIREFIGGSCFRY